MNLAGKPPGYFHLLMRNSRRKAGVTGGIEQGMDRAPAQVRRDSVIGRQAIGKRCVLRGRGLRSLIHHVLRVLPADGLSKFQHDGFGGIGNADQP